jgi:riboflavin synthase alpha subunit
VRKSDFLSFIIFNKKGFRIWIIPHTFEVAALCEGKVEASVDLEVDVPGKSVENSLPHEQRARNSGKRQNAVHYHSTSLKDGVGT